MLSLFLIWGFVNFSQSIVDSPNRDISKYYLFVHSFVSSNKLSSNKVEEFKPFRKWVIIIAFLQIRTHFQTEQRSRMSKRVLYDIPIIFGRNAFIVKKMWNNLRYFVYLYTSYSLFSALYMQTIFGSQKSLKYPFEYFTC